MVREEHLPGMEIANLGNVLTMPTISSLSTNEIVRPTVRKGPCPRHTIRPNIKSKREATISSNLYFLDAASSIARG